MVYDKEGIQRIHALQSRTGPHCNPVQGQYRAGTGFFPVYSFSQGKPCFHYRGTLSSLQRPCFHYWDFPVRKGTQGNLFSLQGIGW